MKLSNYKSITILTLGFFAMSLFNSCTKDTSLVSWPIYPKYVPPVTGEYLASPGAYRNATSGMLYVYNPDGSVKFEKDAGSQTWDFKKWTYTDGTVRYTYFMYDKNAYIVPHVGYAPGVTVLLDQNFKEINRFKFLPNGRKLAANDYGLDGHDFILINDNHYIAMIYHEKKVTNIPSELNPNPDAKIIAPLVQEVVGGNVVWEWDGSNFPELYTSSVEGNEFSADKTQDYAHINAMYIDPKDNNLVFSFRNLNQVMKVNHETGKIMWRLGGKNSDFPITAEQQFLRQHDAHFLSDGKTLILFDNGDLNERPYSRVAEYELDEKNKTIVKSKITNLPNGMFGRYMGSASKHGDIYFVCTGGGAGVQSILEMDVNTGELLKENALAMPSYRAYRY